MSTMAQPPQQRAQFSPPPQNQQRDYAMPNGRSSSFGAPSPQIPITYSSPSPQQYSPQFGQAPPQKRPRLSPDASSPFPNSAYPSVGTPQAASPGPATPLHGPSLNSRPGLMAPPQRPAEKQEQDRSYDDILSGTGINIEEEERNLNRPEYSIPTGSGSFASYQTSSFGPSNGATGSSFGGTVTPGSQITEEQRLKREHERADWEAARHAQHPLWDMFLYGGNLNEKIKKFSAGEHLVEAQAGVLVNTQRNAPPPVVRVNGLEGASRVIDRGQSILDTKDKAERLSDVMKLVSLAAKNRLVGLITASARLALERQQHSKGRVPDEWADIAVLPKATEEANTVADADSSAGGVSQKRKRDPEETPALQAHPTVSLFEQSATNSRAAEEARLAKRIKRKAKASEDKDGDATEISDAALAAALDAEKKTTKKERKATETKFAEQQQHKNANEAARMATSSMIGRTFGKKGKSYSWMTGGAGGGAGATPGGSAVSTPGRGIASSAGTPGTSTPGAPRAPAIPRGRRFRTWDEDNDKGVTAKDLLLILEQDSQAARSYIKGSCVLDGKET